MKPIAICRYAPHEGPGYFATYLTRHRLAWRLVKLDEDEVLPEAGAICGLAMMGGAMSVNDDLPWIPHMLDLIRNSVKAEVPVIGHCLGGQLLAKALGATVIGNPVKEIGWLQVDPAASGIAGAWGPVQPFLSYHWHGETFSIPPAATGIWSSAHCANQGFVLGPHLGMQCHVEMTQDMIASWCDTGADEIERSLESSPAVQRPAQQLENLAARLESLHAVADSIYDRWTQGLKTG